LLAIFTSLDGACDSVSDVIAARLEPSAIEILDKLTIEAVEASVFAAGYPQEAEAVLLIEVEGSEVEVASTVAEISGLVERRGAIEVRRARTALERKKLWAGRKGAFGAMGRIAPDLYVADVVVPRTKLRELVLAATRIAREKRLKLANVFHAGDGNLHPNISYDRRDADEVKRVLAAGDEMMKLVVAAGGSLTGEHGVGLEKQEAMSLVFGDDDLRTMCRVRDAWDPEHRMNPGKLIPRTPAARCAARRSRGERRRDAGALAREHRRPRRARATALRRRTGADGRAGIDRTSLGTLAPRLARQAARDPVRPGLEARLVRHPGPRRLPCSRRAI
jgi:FAD/FMN-containing dehydrogenase